jgi:hypothetical protein
MKIFRRILRRVRDLYAYRYEPERLRMLAHIYWRTVLAGSCLVLVCAFAYGVWTLDAVLAQVEGAATSVGAKPSLPLDRVKLRTAIDAYEIRAARLDALSDDFSPIADPSR